MFSYCQCQFVFRSRISRHNVTKIDNDNEIHVFHKQGRLCNPLVSSPFLRHSLFKIHLQSLFKPILQYPVLQKRSPSGHKERNLFCRAVSPQGNELSLLICYLCSRFTCSRASSQEIVFGRFLLINCGEGNKTRNYDIEENKITATIMRFTCENEAKYFRPHQRFRDFVFT